MSLTIKDLIEQSHKTAIEKGWWEWEPGVDPRTESRPDLAFPRPFGDQTANFYGEIAEAWEEFRVRGIDTEIRYSHEESDSETPKPIGLAVELADLFIRVADTCGRYNIPLEQALMEKLAYNKTRKYRHGNKHA